HIRPVAWFDGPEWFTLYDPTRQSKVEIFGHTEGRRSPGGSYGWTLEWARRGAGRRGLHDARERHPPGRVRRQARRAGPLAGTGVVLRSGVRALDREAARDGRELHGDAPPPRELHGGRHVGADRRGAALDLRASRPGLA